MGKLRIFDTSGMLGICGASEASQPPPSVADEGLVDHVRSMISTIRVCQELTYRPPVYHCYKTLVGYTRRGLDSLAPMNYYVFFSSEPPDCVAGPSY